MNQCDLIVIGGGPAGAAAAIVAARAGVQVVLLEKGPHGRDKVCGDGLTPRAVAALEELKIDLSPAHRIDGLRMIAGKKTRELAWPTTDRFPNHGAVWPRHRFDTHLIDVAIEAGADVHFECAALPELEGDRVVGVRAGGESWRAPLTVLAVYVDNNPTQEFVCAPSGNLGQVLQPGETVQMPVTFYVDPEMVKDTEGQFVHEIVLSYTFHETSLPE